MPLVYDDSIDNVQNQPGTVLAVTASSTSSVYVVGNITVSQSNIPAGTITTSQSNVPAGVNTVSQSNIPVGPFQVASGLGAIGVTGTFYQATQPVSVAATITTSQSNIPAGTQPVSIAATVTTSQSNIPAGALTVTSTLAAPVWITGSVTANAPVFQVVTSDLRALGVSGTFWQGTQPVSVAATVTTSQSNMPAGTQPVSLAATVTTSQSNIPAGTSAVSQTNIPAGPFQVASGLGAIGVSGTFWQATQPVSIAATVATSQSNWPLGASVTATFANVPQPVLLGVNDTANSTTANLGIGGVFTGASFDVYNYVGVVVSIFANQSSAANGVSLQWSADNTNWDEVYAQSYTLNTAVNFVVPHRSRYFRIVYTNGGVAQTAFRLVAIQKGAAGFGDIDEVTNQIVPQDHAQLVRAINIVSGTGGFTNAVAIAGITQVTATSGAPVWITGSVTANAPAFQVVTSDLRALGVSGTFWQATQPVSVAASVQVSQSNTPAGTQTVSQSNIPAGPFQVASGLGAVGVTGTFWQATQPVSIAATVATSQTNIPAGPFQIASGLGAVGVSGTFWQGTQPVSVAATITTSQSNIPAGTQPVSIAATVATSQSNIPAGPFQVASGLGAVGVSGTFWQATQPVSITAAQTLYVNSSATLTVSQSNTPAGIQTVTGTVHIDNSGSTQALWVTGTVTTTAGPAGLTPVTASSTSSVYVTGSVNIGTTVTTSQSNWPAGATVTLGGQPIYINTTATLGVSQSNTPAGVTTVQGAVQATGNVTPADSQANPTNAVPALAYNVGWSDSKGQWDRLRVDGNASDGEATKASGVLETEAYGRMFNGTTWDRVRGTIAGGLAVSQSNTPAGTQATSQSNWPAGATTLIGGQPIYINTTATLGVSQSNIPAGTTPVSATNVVTVAAAAGGVGVTGTFWQATQPVSITAAQTVYVNSSATLTVSQSNTPAGTTTTSQSNWPAGATTLIGGQPIYINTTATLAVSQSNVPLGNTIVYVTSSTTPTVTTQTPSLTGVALKALNSARRGLTIYNQTSQVLYVKMGTTATLTDFTLIMDVSGYYESPFGYNGAVWGIQGAAATGLVYVTEVT